MQNLARNLKTNKKTDLYLTWKCRDHVFPVSERPLIMGILNVTPDSFSDGGCYMDSETAIGQGMAMLEAGADIIDVGGESTRPGADKVPTSTELERVIPVIEGLSEREKLIISIDTMKSEVARRALGAGASIINDVSALTHDPEMKSVAGEFGAGVVLMHRQGTSRTMQDNPQYEDVVKDVVDYLNGRIEELEAFGLDRAAMAVDPGIGFGKTVEHNISLLANMDVMENCGRPVVVGVSRKSFLGKLTGRDIQERLGGSLAAMVFCILKGAHVIRVHDVKESCDALRVVTALKCARKE